MLNRELYYKGERAGDLIMEAIKFQDGKLLRTIAGIIDEVTQDGKPKEQAARFSDGRLQAAVKQATGMDIYFYTDASLSLGVKNYNAAIYPPMLTKNNVLFTSLHANWNYTSDEDGRRLLAKIKNETVGSIDLANCRVTGAFTELKMRSYITRDLLVDKNFTSEEKAAIMLHEIGHGFTWIEMIAETACFNMAIMTASRALMESDDDVKHIELARAVNECLNVEVDPKLMAQSKDVETWYTVYLKASLDERRNASNSGYYSDTASEFLADQFAVRHGAGVHLASAMSKVYKYYKMPSVQNRYFFWMVFGYKLMRMIAAVIGGVIAVASGAGIFPLLGALVTYAFTAYRDENYGIYDDNKERLAKMRRELITRLKDADITPEERKETLEAIATIQEAENVLYDHKTFNQALAYWLNPVARRNVNQRTMQQEIEKTLNNNLFVSAGKIGSLGQA